VNIFLNDVETRVLGALIEKEITTPDYYPLSLNALVNACNQKSNRDPVMTLDEDAVSRALQGLRDKELAAPADTSDSRVRKYEHRLQETYNFDRREAAIMCELLLRGAQTPGELRSRAERMHRFSDLAEVQSILQRLMSREPPLVKVLARQPGTKEPRYAHLLAGDVQTGESSDRPPATRDAVKPEERDRLAELERSVAGLQEQVDDLRRLFADFRRQFE
jgi:uncharacterized protein YceH (UPF0502 family)